jgi:CheY-like chemotaxis protein
MNDAQPLALDVLIVEDDPLVRELVYRVARARCRSAHAVEDGLRGIAALTQMRFDLVITDLKMPGASGFEVATALRAQGGAVGLVVMSGFLERGDESRLNALEARVLRKPFGVASLYELLDACARDV